jgi:hypothetical protein
MNGPRQSPSPQQEPCAEHAAESARSTSRLASLVLVFEATRERTRPSILGIELLGETGQLAGEVSHIFS